MDTFKRGYISLHRPPNSGFGCVEGVNMNYLVIQDSRRNGKPLFLVDRRHTKSKWWTSVVDEAMWFKNESAALIQSRKLIFNNPGIITLKEAQEIEEEHFDDHPFSSEALGQE